MNRKERKFDRKGNRHQERQKKSKFHGNRYTAEQETSFAGTSAEKLLSLENKEIVDSTHGYCILEFFFLFFRPSVL